MLSEFQTEFGSLFLNIITISTVVTAISLIGIFLVANKITRPIISLRNATRKVEDGIFDAEIQIEGTGEIADLEKSFSHMFNSLKKTIELEKKLALSEQKLKNEKFAVVDSFAARFAHDMKNRLSAMNINVELLKTKFANTDEKSSNRFKTLEKSIDEPCISNETK